MSDKNNQRRGIRHPQSFPPCYYMPRPPTTSDKFDRWTGKRYELSSFWIIGKNPINGIPVASGTEGDLYYLCKFDSSGDAIWCKFDVVPGGSGLDAIVDQDGNVVDLDGSGQSSLSGVIVANAANTPNPFKTVKNLTDLELQLQLATTVTPTPVDTRNVGLSCYNENHFTFDDTSGMVSISNPADNVPLRLGTNNISAYYSSPTYTLKGADGNDLSASNPGYITTYSNVNLGQLVTTTLTSNVTFEDADGTSILAGSLFGFNTGDDTLAGGGSNIPFYLYVSLDNTDDNPIFWISRIPNHTEFLGTQVFNAGSGLADLAQNGLTFSSVTLANYENSSVLLVGSLDMSLNGSDDWNVQNATNFPRDVGVGRFNERSRNFPRGVMGARAGSYFIDNGGTAPTISTSTNFAYLIEKSGRFNWDISMAFTGSPAGDVEARLIAPLTGFSGTTVGGVGQFSTIVTGLHVNKCLVSAQGDASGYYKFNKVDGTPSTMMYSEISASDILRIQLNKNL